MKITSLEIKQHEFEKTFRGYDIEEVDIFLNNIANEWERITNENKMLRMQLEIAEKEATKLREVEMTLIKTLKSAEETGAKITDQAKFEANRAIEDAKSSAQNTINSAENDAQQILANANAQAEEIVANANAQVSKAEQAKIDAVSELDQKIEKLSTQKESLISKLRSIYSETEKTLHIIDQEEVRVTSAVTPKEETIEKKIVAVAVESTKQEKQEVTSQLEEEEEEIQSVASSANSITLEEEELAQDNLEIIEGIGPKIAELLQSDNISTYRTLATTPVYKIKEILTAAGPHFAMHDPTSWVEQALLAEEGRFEELEVLKEKLIAGRKPEAIIPKEVVDQVEPSSEAITEEMLDRVNKVKAALRKAMQEKEAIPTKNDSLPKKETLNDLIGKQRQEESGGSFFDNIN